MTYGTLTRRNGWNPWRDLPAIQHEVNRLFGGLDTGHQARTYFQPVVDVLRGPDSIIVRADLPGMSKENIELTVLNNQLILRGSRKKQDMSDSVTLLKTERFHGKFERVITFPARINPEQVKASFQDGVLEVTAPLQEAAKPRRIPLEVK